MNKVIKRRYISPKLEEHQIDNEISLILMTSETTPPDPPRRGAAQEENPFESNPFDEKQQ